MTTSSPAAGPAAGTATSAGFTRWIARLIVIIGKCSRPKSDGEPGRSATGPCRGSIGTVRAMPTLFEYAGGEQALHRLEQVFYDSVLTDPLLQPLFGAGLPDHVDHLTAFAAESFGGPDRFSRGLGFAHLLPRREVGPSPRNPASAW